MAISLITSDKSLSVPVRKPTFLNVGDLRKLISGLADDTSILFETDDDEMGKMTFKLEQVEIARTHIHELEDQNFDISYFHNTAESSVPVLVICAHEGNLDNYSVSQVGPGHFLYTPMKQIEAKDGSG
jgi:hypothetical protein